MIGGGERGKRYIFAMEMPTPSPGFLGSACWVERSLGGMAYMIGLSI